MAEAAGVIRDAPEVAATAPADDEFVAAGPAAPAAAKAAPLLLRSLTRDELGDVLASVASATFSDPVERAAAAAAADKVAHDDATWARLAGCPDHGAEVRLLQDLIRQRVEAEPAPEGALAGMGPGLWQNFKDRLGEATGRRWVSPASS